MLAQNSPAIARFSSKTSDRSSVPYFAGHTEKSSYAYQDSDVYSVGQSSTSELLPSRPASPKHSNGLFGLLKKNLKKQESATQRMQRQIQKDIQTQEKDRKRVLKDIYYLAIEYNLRTEWKEMLIGGYRSANIESVNVYNPKLKHQPTAIKDLKLEEEIPEYDLGVFKRSNIYSNVHGKNNYRLPLREYNMRTLGIPQTSTVDDMGDLLVSPARSRRTNGELSSHQRLYPDDLGNHFAFKHPARTVRSISPEERKMLRENQDKQKQVEAEIEKIMSERLTPINHKLEQYKQDLTLLEEAAASAKVEQPYTDMDDSQST